MWKKQVWEGAEKSELKEQESVKAKLRSFVRWTIQKNCIFWPIERERPFVKVELRIERPKFKIYWR